MRILLVGEYSRLHNSLKEGLLRLGHEVVLVSDGDGFKQYPTDLSYAAATWTKKPLNFLRQAIFRFTGYDMAKNERGRRFRRLLADLTDFDVVQLINEAPIKTYPTLELRLIKQLIAQNRKAFLLCCGIDFTVLKYMESSLPKYTLLDEYNANPELKPFFNYIFEYKTAGRKKIHEFLFANVNGIIASDIDYLLPLKGHPKFIGLIPNPVIPTEAAPAGTDKKIVIFLGINKWTRYQKGIRYFEEALDIITSKYREKVKVVIAQSLPYQEYIKLLEQADIVLDQVYAYDQGYNALEAMAMGKAVFTGAEAEFMSYYNLTETVAVNALPDTKAIVSELSILIENPEQIAAIGKRARQFVLTRHNHISIAEQYLEKWRKC